MKTFNFMQTTSEVKEENALKPMLSMSGSSDFYTLYVDERTIHRTCFKDTALFNSNNTSTHGLGPCVLFPSLSFTICITGTASASSPYVTENLFENPNFQEESCVLWEGVTGI